MRNVLFFTLLCLLIITHSFAAIRRVGYTGTALSGVDYPSLADAQNRSSAGDTIQIYGSVDGTDITKPLVIMGFGYNFDANPGLQAVGTDAPSSITGGLSFRPGSEGSTLEGCSIALGYEWNLFASDITIKRCYILFRITLHNEIGPINNIKIVSCAITGAVPGIRGGIYMNNPDINPCLNFQLLNSILGGSCTFYLAGSTGSIINCVTGAPGFASQDLSLNTATFLVKNCMLFFRADANPNTVFENNFFSNGQPGILPAGSNNRWNQSWGNLFSRLGNDNAGIPGTPEFDEDYYVLLPGSPAVNGGFDNSNNPTDCGIYGGEAAFRYKLSGVPAVPAIYKLSAPGSAATGNPYNVTINVRSNN